MSREACPNPQENCKYAPDCYSDVHHPAWPRAEYTTRTEKVYRALGCIQLCRRLHDIEHTYSPPDKPSVEEMRIAINPPQEEVA